MLKIKYKTSCSIGIIQTVVILLILLIALSGTSYADNNFTTPEGVFEALLKAITTRDKALYEECLNRPLKEKELDHIKELINRPGNRVTKIDNINVLKRGYEYIGIDRVFYIFSEQTWRYGNGKKETLELDLHFVKFEDRWIFIPIEGQLFLFQ